MKALFLTLVIVAMLFPHAQAMECETVGSVYHLLRIDIDKGTLDAQVFNDEEEVIRGYESQMQELIPSDNREGVYIMEFRSMDGLGQVLVFNLTPSRAAAKYRPGKRYEFEGRYLYETLDQKGQKSSLERLIYCNFF